MKWYEFTEDGGDGSYFKRRFKTKEEAEEALEFMQENISWFLGDGDGVNVVDTETAYFFESLKTFNTCVCILTCVFMFQCSFEVV